MVYIAATNLDFLRASPGNWLELLKGDRKGDYRIRINDQWRICLKFANGIRQLIGALAGFRGSDCYISKGHGGITGASWRPSQSEVPPKMPPRGVAVNGKTL